MNARLYNSNADVRRIREDKARTLPIAEWKPLDGIIEPDGHPLISEAVAWFLIINAVFWGCALYVVYG